MQEIKHPFLISLSWSCKDSSFLYLLFPYVCGGELFSYLRRYCGVFAGILGILSILGYFRYFSVFGGILDVLRSAGRFSPSTTLFYSAEIVSALEYLHSLSVAYR